MGRYDRYKLYQKYEKRGSQESIPVYPNTYSINGDGTMPIVIVRDNDPDCGYTGDTQPQYRWYPMPISSYYYCEECPTQYRWVNMNILTDYECVGTSKYYKQKRQYSYNGSDWYDFVPEETQRGSLYQSNSPDCGYIEPQYRTTSGTPYCSGYDKYVAVYSQVSYNGGQTWTTTATTNTLVERNSTDCGGGGDYENQYFTAIPHVRTAFEFRQNGNAGDGYPIQYSLDEGVTWQTVSNNTQYPFVEAGQKIMWKAHARPYNSTGQDPKGCGYFYSTNQVGQNQPPLRIFAGEDYTVEGNIMSLVYGDDFRGKKDLSEIGDHAFMELFQAQGYRYADNLILPATGLTTSCYEKMFAKSFGNNLLLPPKVLPAKNLASYCYFDMFRYNSEMTTVPTLSATSLASGCFERMFANCSSITSVPINYLPFTSLRYYCYSGMFQGCTSLTTAPLLPATTLANGCYSGMFQGCTSLTTAPQLLATTLGSECYYEMFRGCTRLNYIKCLATNISASWCTTDWVNGVASSGTFYKASSMSSWTSGNNGIPSGWVVENYEPTFEGKWIATYSNSSTSSAACDSTSAITSGEVTTTNLVSVEIGDCVTSIGSSAFQGCTSLIICTIGSGVTSIGNYAFASCSGLTSVNIPSGVTSIGRGAFNKCRSLTSIVIPSGVTSIGIRTFYNCTTLTSVNIPSGVTSIGNDAFSQCTSLTSIIVKAITPPTLGNNSVFNNTNNCPIYVPSASVSAYQTAWSTYSSRIQAIP